MEKIIFNNLLPIAIGSDHAGYELKKTIKSFLEKKGLLINDFGTYSTESVDYPDFAHPVALDVENHKAACGILICGSGEGVCITANKHQNIRASLCWDTQLAELSRLHNNANIICLPARFITNEKAFEMIEKFLTTPFEGGRHENRVLKINCS